jgi:hypothetical protein
MPRIWRMVAPVAVAGGLLAAGAIPAASASPAAYTISITAHSSLSKVSGHTLVVYRGAGYNTATISGTVDGAVTGDVATLWARPFGASGFTATTDTVALSPDTETPTVASYSFVVGPARASAYEVQVTTGTTVDVTSGTQTVYVTAGGKLTDSHKKCTSSTCTSSFKVWEYVPAAALKTESKKHFYLYLAVGYPKLPKNFTLSKTATASKVKKINSGEFELLLTFHITLHHGAASWESTFCTKDTESKDGMGLPGSHGCGDKYVSMKAKYVG